MTTKTLKQAGLVLALMGAATMAQAQKGEGKGPRGERPNKAEILKKYDVDGDGKLSDSEKATLREEMGKKRGGKKGKRGERPNREEMTKKFDTDGDGQLSEEERTAMKAAMKKYGAKKGGPKGENGKDKKGERPNREEMTKKFDTDGDGQLSEDERAAMKASMQKRGGKKGGPKGENGKGKKGEKRMSRKDMVKKYDVDGDGKLNDDERSVMRKEMKKNRHKKAE